ncbi:RagB/SusD family nutrient uptake outer membrane protein [Panacibacter sp. DH6]|uniref:RagB/SusD family nutrient uptake outer membrane protein n=1 Tax=Panacibacter microcysteis TaxID=2793269 RepID=A0A931H0K7_9BACT|nr:RagB/SusD family nutrient uptake outer membrane protein [Panacibacter microcysteis]MBG9378793.1 RagB/SusD family nutrient uptake outer membrane protein [Panacibacter microcysteis]
MKNIIIVSLMLMVVASCTKQLDKSPYGVVSTENFYKTAADAEMAVTAAYKSFQTLDGQNGWNTRAGYTPMGDITGPDVQAHPDLVVYYQIQQSIISPSSDQILMLYQRCYSALLLANVAIEKIPAIEMDEQVKSRFMGELYFIRGFWLFRLGYMFGTAPLVTSQLGIADLNVPNSKREAVYEAGKSVNNYTVTKSDLFDQAETDFKMALQQQIADRNTGDLMGRADKGAVKAYLAQIYLYEHRWNDAKLLLEEIMSYGYALLPDYNDVFNGTHDNSSEAVFEVQYTAMNQKGTDNFGTVLTAPNGEGYVAGGGWGWTRPTPDLESEYEAGDPRLVASIFRKNKDDFFGQLFLDKVNGTGLGIRKWCIANAPNNNGVTVDQVSWNNSANYTLVRYAEVLLWYAEVMNELGNPAAAASYVNMVRQRTATTTDPNTINHDVVGELPPVSGAQGYEEMFWTIVHERRIELAFEGKFGWDLRRWGIAEAYLSNPSRWQNEVTPGYFKFKEGKDEIFPLPQIEIDRAGGTLVQNAGY